MKGEDKDGIFIPEGLDDVLLGLGMLPESEAEEEFPGDPNDVSDLEGLGVFLWMNEEVDKERARREKEKEKGR